MLTDNQEEWLVNILAVVAMILGVILVMHLRKQDLVKPVDRPTPIDGECRKDLTEEAQWDTVKGFGDGTRTQHGTRVLFAPVEEPKQPQQDAHDEHLEMMKEMWINAR